MQHFKFVNWSIGEFVVSFFDVTNRLLEHENRFVNRSPVHVFTENEKQIPNFHDSFSELSLLK